MWPAQRDRDDVDRLRPLVNDRVHGALLGTALGHGLGAPFQQQRQVDLDEVQEWAKSTQPLSLSRDVARCLDVALTLARLATVDEVRSAVLATAPGHRSVPERSHVAPEHAHPGGPRGPGADHAGRPENGRGRSSGFRAAHAAPLGLAALGLDTGPATTLAAMSAAASAARTAVAAQDADRSLQDAAALQAAAVTAAATSAAGIPFTPEWLCRRLSIAVDALHLRRPITRAADLAATQSTPWRAAQLLATSDPEGPNIDVSAPAALTAWLRHPDDPVTAVLYAIAIGGQTAAVAGMAGAIAGARCGPHAWPGPWLSRLPNLPALTDAADELTTAICRWLRGPAPAVPDAPAG